MKQQAALLFAALVLLAAGAVYFLRSGDGTAEPVIEGPPVAAPEAPIAEPATLAALEPGQGPKTRVAAKTGTGLALDAGLATDGSHPWEGQLAGVTGRLVETDGTPVTGLEVELIEVDGNMFSDPIHHPLQADSLIVGKGRSGADGVFHLGGARGAGFHGLTIDPGGGRSTVRLVEQSLSYSEITDLGDVVLGDYGVAIGTVIDEDGEPVAGARVRLAPVPEIAVQVGILDVRRDSMLAFGDERVEVLSLRQKFLDVMDRLPAATGITDEEGAFRIEGVPIGTISGGVDRVGHVFSAIATFEMIGPDEHDCGEVELLFGRTARGQVIDAAGAPVAGIEVRAGALHPMFSFGLLQTGVVTSESGTFAIETIPEEGTIIGAARRWDGDPWTVATAVGSGENVTIKLESDASLRVHLALDDGTPVQGATFRLRSLHTAAMGMGPSTELTPMMKRSPARPATSEPEPGQYELAAVPLGSWMVEAEIEGMAPNLAQVDHTADGPPLEITVRGGRTMNIMVVDSVTKEPIGAAHASFVVPGASLPTAIVSGWSNDAGVLRLGPFSPDLETRQSSFGMRRSSLGLVVEKPGYAQYVMGLSGIDETPQQGLDRTIELLRGGTIVGRVTWAGAPPQDRYMALLEFEGPEFSDLSAPRLATTDVEGRFRIDGLMAGEYNLTVMERFLGGNPLGLMQLDHEPVTYARDMVTVTAGEETPWDLNLLGDGTVPKGWFEGRVLLDGTPPVGGVVRISENEDSYEIPLDGTGSFRSQEFDAQRIQNVQITIQAADGNGELKDEQIYQSWDRVPAGRGKKIMLEYQNRPLRITVLDAITGDPVRGASITHLKDRNYAQAGPTDDRGVASIRLRMESSDTEANLQITAEGYADGYESVPLDGPLPGLTVRLAPVVKCAGRVIVPPSVSDEYLLVSPVDQQGQANSSWCSINDEGLFASEELKAGTYRARLGSMDENGKHLTFVLGPNGDTEIVLDFTSL